MTRRAWKASARWAALGVLLSGLGVAAGPAEAVTLIQSCPYTIMQPGLYVLARDLTCPGADPAIRITADNVVLNLNGNTLTGDGGEQGVLAEDTDANPTLEGLRVENGTVTGFQDGIEVQDAPGARVARVTATGNSFSGINVDDSPGARVEGNITSGNGEAGIALDGCDGCELSANRVDDNGNDGIRTFGASPRARFVGNILTGNEDDGLDLTGNCEGCVVAGNRAAGNGGSGLELFAGVTGARVEGNTVTGNGAQGIDLSRADIDGNLVRGNTATGNGSSGIRVAAGATGNRLEGNTATGNAEFDLFDENLPACVNTWRGNRFVTDNEGDGPGAGCIQ